MGEQGGTCAFTSPWEQQRSVAELFVFGLRQFCCLGLCTRCLRGGFSLSQNQV